MYGDLKPNDCFYFLGNALVLRQGQMNVFKLTDSYKKDHRYVQRLVDNGILSVVNTGNFQILIREIEYALSYEDVFALHQVLPKESVSDISAVEYEFLAGSVNDVLDSGYCVIDYISNTPVDERTGDFVRNLIEELKVQYTKPINVNRQTGDVDDWADVVRVFMNLRF